MQYVLEFQDHCTRVATFIHSFKCSSELFVSCCSKEKCIYRVSHEECARLRESVPYVKVYRYNPKHLYPKLNCYGDNGQRKVRSSCGVPRTAPFQLTRYVYSAHVVETGMQSTLCLHAHVKCLEP